MSSGNFKLDEKGRIGALKRLLPQEIVSSMILISANLRTYKEAREFALEQSAELRNSAPKKKQGQTNYMGAPANDADDDFDPWANGGMNNGDADKAPDDWTEDQINAVINALKGKGKPRKGSGKG